MKRFSAIAATAMFLLYFTLSSHAARADNPGDACSPNGAAGVNGVMQMTCTSGVWVLNALKLGDSGVACSASTAGYIKWDGNKFLGCGGASWRPLDGRQISVSIADLTAQMPSCTSAAQTACANGTGSCWVIQYCNVACSRYCRGIGYGGGEL